MSTPLTVCITTFNNEATLPVCLESVSWADELLVLDSGSQDRTQVLAQQAGAQLHTQPFAGYGPQKQRAIDLAKHDWVLLLDADEALSQELALEVQNLLATRPALSAYRLPRSEQMFWTWQHTGTRHNHYLRLFDRRTTRMEAQGIHAAPVTTSQSGQLQHPIRHWGEPDIATKVDKVNRYSSALATEKANHQVAFVRTRMLLYPPVAFLRAYVFKRLFLNGWAGLISAFVMGFYAFMKYAKLHELKQSAKRPDHSGSGP